MECTNIIEFFYLLYKISKFGCIHGDEAVLCVVQSEHETKEVGFSYGRGWLSYEFNPC